MACSWERDEIAFFLIKEEQEMVIKQRHRAQFGWPGRGTLDGQQQPSYNMRDRAGESPVFWTSSSAIMEEMLKLPDLDLEDGKGRQLLERCENALCR